jgi:hypothetical protein
MVNFVALPADEVITGPCGGPRASTLSHPFLASTRRRGVPPHFALHKKTVDKAEF